MKYKTRRFLSCLLTITAFASPSGNARSAEKSSKLPPVRIGYVSRSILDMPFIIARDAAISEKRVWSPNLFL